MLPMEFNLTTGQRANLVDKLSPLSHFIKQMHKISHFAVCTT